MVDRIAIDFTLPPAYIAQHFWKIQGGGATGFSIAVGPIFALGFEIIWLPETRGLALLIGPFWIGAARYRPAKEQTS